MNPSINVDEVMKHKPRARYWTTSRILLVIVMLDCFLALWQTRNISQVVRSEELKTTMLCILVFRTIIVGVVTAFAVTALRRTQGTTRHEL